MRKVIIWNTNVVKQNNKSSSQHLPSQGKVKSLFPKYKV